MSACGLGVESSGIDKEHIENGWCNVVQGEDPSRCHVLYTNLSSENSWKPQCEDHRSGKVLSYMLNWCGYVTFLPHIGAGRDGGRGWSVVHPTHERYGQTDSGPATISRNDGVTDSAVNPGSLQHRQGGLSNWEYKALPLVFLCAVSLYIKSSTKVWHLTANTVTLSESSATSHQCYERYDGKSLRS